MSTFITSNSSLVKQLSDRLYDKRRAAAVAIGHHVRELVGEAKTESIEQLIDHITTNFVFSTYDNSKKGGLVALASVAVSIGDQQILVRFLPVILQPVLRSFLEQDSSVRYYACESCYNIAKVARVEIVPFFNDVFDGLCKLSADLDDLVKKGAQLLDRLINDIVIESRIINYEFLDGFIQLLKSRMKTVNPSLRQFLIDWLRTLDEMPGVQMARYVPVILAELFQFLQSEEEAIVTETSAILAQYLHAISLETESEIQFRPMVETLLRVCRLPEAEEIAVVTTINWLTKFIEFGKDLLAPHAAEILRVVLPMVSRGEEGVRSAANVLSSRLSVLVESSDSESTEIAMDVLLRITIMEVESDRTATRLAALKWMLLLIRKAPDYVPELMDSMLASLLAVLSDSSEPVVQLDLSVLATVAGYSDSFFERVMVLLLRQFEAAVGLLETRGALIVRELCHSLGDELTFRTFSRLLASEEDDSLVIDVVRHLNLILLADSNMRSLREQIRDSAQTGDSDLFEALVASWGRCPTSCLALCLQTEAYDNAVELVHRFEEMEMSVGVLVQLDRLVQLLESPIFTRLRLHLIEPRQYRSLYKALFGILMLLPQGKAYDLLSRRLNSCRALAVLETLEPIE